MEDAYIIFLFNLKKVYITPPSTSTQQTNYERTYSMKINIEKVIENIHQAARPTSALKKVNFYLDDVNDNIVYAEYDLNNKQTTMFTDINSKSFRAYLTENIRPRMNQKIINECTQAIHDYLILERDKGNNVTCHAYKRFGYTNEHDKISINLKDHGNVIEINESGFSITKQSDVKFVSSNLMKSQKTPIDCHDLDKYLRKHINLSDDDYIIFKCMLIQSFIPWHQHYISIFRGEQGCGKTELINMMSKIIDPSSCPISSLTANLDSVVSYLSNVTFASFDNINYIDNETSNLLCQVATKGSGVKRKLYSDNDLVVLEYNNIIALSGITLSAKQDDLASRCILFEPLSLTSENRKSQLLLNDEFESDLENILGAICNILSEYLKTEKSFNVTTHVDERMKETFDDMIIIASCMGISEEKFVSIFEKNKQRKLNQLESKAANKPDNIILNTIIDFIENKDLITDTVGNIHSTLCNSYPDFKATVSTASQFSSELKKLKDVLSDNNISFDFRNAHKGYKKLIIRKLQSDSQISLVS